MCEQVISTSQGSAERNDHSADYFPALTGTVREGNITVKRLNTAPMFNVLNALKTSGAKKHGMKMQNPTCWG